MENFVPVDFEVPVGPVGDGYRLEPLGAEHNERDHAAWSSSIEHIQATPGFAGWGWPLPMTLEQNLADLERHADDFAARSGFTYSVLDNEDGVIGCVYIYPRDATDGDADVRSWVRQSHAHLDEPLWRSVSAWLAADWPFTAVSYASR